MLEEELKVIDASRLSPRELNRELKKISERTKRVIIENPNGKHHIAAGLRKETQILIKGSVGYFVGTMVDGPRIEVDGNAGWFVGDNMTNGSVFVKGHAGNGSGQGLYGGTIVVKGDVGDRAGALMKRGAIIIEGGTGIMTGIYMMGGDIIILRKPGEYLGESIIGGRIFFSSPEPSLGKNATMVEVDKAEYEFISNLLLRNGIDGISRKFKKIVPKNLRPFYNRQKETLISFKRGKFRYQVLIDHNLCKKCGACVKICPQGVFKNIEEGYITPINDFECVGCETCVEYCPVRAIRVHPVPETSKHTWSRDTIDEIQLKSSSGHPIVRGSGAWRRFPHFDDLILLCAQTSRPPIDHYREPCSTSIVIGKRYAEKPLKLNAPMIIGAMSFGAVSKETKIAIAKAATKVGVAVNTGEGGLLTEERENASLLITQYASGRFGVSAKYLQSADAIEIKIGQGAKSGQGGLLMGEKVDEEIASVRGIPIGTDAVSPARHLDIVGPEDLKMKIEQLREVTDWKIPIIVKYSAGRVRDDVKIAAKAGADAILIDGKQAGTGAAPDIILEHAGLPTLPALVEADRGLKEIGLREDISLLISGGIRNGADVAKALALGADAVAMATSVLIAIGCRVCGLCSTGRCPRGIATQEPSLRKRLNVDFAAERVENYLRATIAELEMLTQLTGKTDVRNLDKEDLRALSIEAATITGVKLVGCER
ncbi:MAG: glutamate synthase-related protein [Nitrososphaeria archaeon]